MNRPCTEVPGAALNLRVKEVWSRSANIMWTAPFAGNSPLSKYTIQYWRHQNAPHRLHEATVSSSQTSAIVENLQPGIAYEVSIVSENEVGRGEASASATFTTGEEEPNAAPIDIAVEARGATTVLVKWKAPPADHWNGKLKGFYIGYKTSDSAHPYSFRTVDAKHGSAASTGYEFFVTNLLKGTEYFVVVKAFNDAGSGPASQDIAVTTLNGDLPSAPQLFVLNTGPASISLRWNNKDAAKHIHDINGYSIHYQKDSEGWREVPVSGIIGAIGSTAMPANGEPAMISTVHANTYTLNGLEGGSRYHVYVTALNKYGIGDPSNVVTVTTEGGSHPKVFSSTINNHHSVSGGMNELPYFAQPIFLIPIVVAVVIIVVVLLMTFVCVKKMRPPSPDYADGCNCNLDN